MSRANALPLLLGILSMTACAIAPPAGPAVLALPPQGKDLTQFRQEDTSCRGYAQQQIGYGSQQQAANQNAIGSAAVGTALGAAAGAAIASAAGTAGTGAAVGAGAGLLAGSAVGTSNASASAAVLQQQYDIAYAQCMAARGNTVQFPPTWPYAPYGYPYDAFSTYYDPWFGPPVAFGFFGGFGHRFHHHGFFHHGFHRR
jgi:hypothetical protein